jgi:serine/threonine-protein kinase
MSDSSDVSDSKAELQETREARADDQSTPEVGFSQTLNLPGMGHVQVDDLNNQRLGEFHLLRRLGSGGMADVYLAEQTSLKRHVAVKVLRADSVSNESYLQRFIQEAKTAAALNHPNIVQVYAIGNENGIHYIAQEYVRGMNLRDFIRRQGPPSLKVALHVMKQVAQALQAAGEAGIVHRDIKPENIMVTSKGSVKVTDWLQLTQDGTTMGTPLYMSPEQVNGKKLDQRSDIYSFGVTCYHLLAGQPPFNGETAISVAVKHLNETPQPLTERRPDLPSTICDVISRMMAKKPENRYPSAESVLKDLKRIKKAVQDGDDPQEVDLGEFDTTVAPSYSTPLAIPLWRRDLVRQLVFCIGTAVLVAGIFGFIGWSTRARDPFQTPPPTSRIARLATAEQQFYLAFSLVDNIEAWEAVPANFPNAFLETRIAREKLAFLYLRADRFSDAERLFEQFISETDRDPALAAKGHAGLAIVAVRRSQYKRALQIVEFDLKPLENHLDPETREFVLKAVEKSRAGLGIESDQDIDEFFDNPK